jgi:inner membrane protein
MPTPAGHALAALAAWTACRPWARGMVRSPWFWLLLVSANAPDLDFLPGLLMGNEALFHRGAGHSIGGAVLYALAIMAATAAVAGGGRAALAGALAFLLFTSHLVLDLFVRDIGAPYGIQLFWPFTHGYTMAPWWVFPALDRHPFDWSVVGRAIPVVGVELLLLGPLVAAAALLRRRRRGAPRRNHS